MSPGLQFRWQHREEGAGPKDSGGGWNWLLGKRKEEDSPQVSGPQVAGTGD